MNRVKLLLVAVLAVSFSFAQAQVEKVMLEQMPGKFVQESLELEAGDYQFVIANNNVGHDVGFVLVPKGKYDASMHIKEAYVTAPVANGKEGMTNVVSLEAGMYEYFCPLNPTAKNTLVVHESVETIKLGQVPGDFTVKGLTVAPGTYQFEISNDGVDHELGFVLTPKGKYDASMHIKTGYVKETVEDGESSLTGIVELAAGEYEYFCPLNPTPKYTLTVK